MPSRLEARQRRRLPLTVSLICSLMLMLSGMACGGKSQMEVHGQVTFKGEPVTEGTIQFNDDKTGNGAEVELRSDGSYQAILPPGRYTVVILPPLVNDVRKNPSSPPGQEYKKAPNIPPKYRSTATSNLGAMVSADKTVHDFELASP